MSGLARRKIAAAQRARWKNWKAQQKNPTFHPRQAFPGSGAKEVFSATTVVVHGQPAFIIDWHGSLCGFAFSGTSPARARTPRWCRPLETELPFTRDGSFPPGWGWYQGNGQREGKRNCRGISKRGNTYLRKMFIHGARAVVLRAKREGSYFGAVDEGLGNQSRPQCSNCCHREQAGQDYSGPYCVLTRLLLLDTRFSDSRRAVEYNRETDDHAAWLHDLLKPHVDRVVVCDPRTNALLKDGSKSDRIDARKLAELLRGNGE
jgi:hypothetical protein